MASNIALACVVLFPILYSLIDYFYLSKEKFSKKNKNLQSAKNTNTEYTFNSTFEEMNLKYVALMNDNQFLEVINSKQKNNGIPFDSVEIERKCSLVASTFSKKNKEALDFFK